MYATRVRIEEPALYVEFLVHKFGRFWDVAICEPVVFRFYVLHRISWIVTIK